MNRLVEIEATDASSSLANWVATANDPSLLASHFPGAGSASAVLDALNDGDLLGYAMGSISEGADAVGTSLDPIGALLASCASVLITYMPPLPEILDSLTGRPELVSGVGATWGNITDALIERAAAVQAQTAQVLSAWTGAAADAYAARMADVVSLLKALAACSAGLGVAIMLASKVIEFYRALVKELISILVGKLIAWFVEFVGTASVATPVIIAQVVATAAGTTARVIDIVKELVMMVQDTCAAMSEATSGLDALTTAIDEMKNRTNPYEPGLEGGG